jgi:hypothetical protein
LSSAGTDRIRSQVAAGWKLLQAGSDRDAADLFGRILLQDPDCAEARRGLAQARAAAAERHRRLEAGLDQARRVADAGDLAAARKLLQEIVDQGGDRDRARAALDRLDVRGGRVDHDLLAGDGAAGLGREGISPPLPPAWARRALALSCALGFALLAAGVDSRWEGLIEALEGAPRPASSATPVPTAVAPLSRGEQALTEARRLMEQGDAAGALRALDLVRPEEPAYPFARQLRRQAENALRPGRWN